MQVYRSFILPFLNRLDPERAHDMSITFLHTLETLPGGLALLRKLCGSTSTLEADPRLKITINNLRFNSPLMVAAGMDKQGRCIQALHAIGFSAVEAGSVTLQPQNGHPKPRIFRIVPGVIINRCGFNSIGALAFRDHLKHYQECDFPIGISLGQNAGTPLDQSAKHFAELYHLLQGLADYYVINVSSPNTSGLRDLQQGKELLEIVQTLSCPAHLLFVKVSPDLSLTDLDIVIQICLEQGLGGVIASNTTLDPHIKARYQAETIQGGLSGNCPAFRQRSTELCQHIYQATQGRLPIMAVGGVRDAYTTLEKITAGASLVQIMSALSEQGPGIANTIKKDLIAFMEQHHIQHILDCQGKPEYLKAFAKTI